MSYNYINYNILPYMGAIQFRSKLAISISSQVFDHLIIQP